MFNSKVFLAEFIGTFALVFVGAAAGVYGQSMGLLGIALAHGLTLMALVYIYGDISGTHINPAVTFGFALNGTIKWIEAVVYWVAQFSGAVVAAFLLRTFVNVLSATAFGGAATSGLLTDVTKYPAFYAVGLEALLAFFLVTSFLHTAEDGKAGQFTGLAVGLTLTIVILAGGPLTGAAVNPARSFGPAVFTSALDASKPDIQNSMLYLIYFVGPLVGSALAVLSYRFFKLEPTMSEEEIEDMDDMEEVEMVEVVEEVVVEEPMKKSTRKSTARKSMDK